MAKHKRVAKKAQKKIRGGAGVEVTIVPPVFERGQLISTGSISIVTAGGLIRKEGVIPPPPPIR